jgi:Carboxypeptidase regulatory-like domain
MKRLVAACLFLFPPIFGQTNRGGISGSVTDPSGAVVPGATVIITDAGTNQAHTAITSSSGSYILQNLEPVTVSGAHLCRSPTPDPNKSCQSRRRCAVELFG